MKKLIVPTLLIAILTACNSSSSSEGSKPAVIKHDTVNVLALYRSAYQNEVKFGIVQRVTTDSLMFVDVDSVTKVKKWGIDTTYIISYPQIVDSALSKQYHLPIKDSTGKQNVINMIVVTDKKFVRSGWNRADSITIKEMMNIK